MVVIIEVGSGCSEATLSGAAICRFTEGMHAFWFQVKNDGSHTFYGSSAWYRDISISSIYE
jgi:hypothetical protein